MSMKHRSFFYLTCAFFLLSFGTRYSVAETNGSVEAIKNTQEELVIPFDLGQNGEKVAMGLLAGSAFLFTLSSLFLLATRSSNLFYLFLVTEVLTGLALLSSANGYKRMKDKEPIAIFNREGVWINSCGVISWDHIETVGIIEGPSSFAKAVGIKIKQDSLPAVKSQLTLKGRIGLLWSNFLCRQCHIFLPSASVPVEEIVSFSECFIS